MIRYFNEIGFQLNDISHFVSNIGDLNYYIIIYTLYYYNPEMSALNKLD